MTEEPPRFEQAHARLEEIVRRLEAGDVALDEALDLWRQGEELYRLCLELLTQAEGRVDELAAEQDDNRPGTL